MEPQEDHKKRIAFQDSTDNSITGNSAPVATGGSVHDRTGLLLAIGAFGFALLAVGMEVNRTISQAEYRQLQDQAIEAKIRAGVAQAEATAHAADVNSRVSIDKLQELRVQLAQKGIHVNVN